MSQNSYGALRRVELVVLDFDGVLTDNKVLVDENGKESVRCDRSDGLGIELLKGAGIEVFVLSKERNVVVQRRCEKLGIQCIQGVDEKLSILDKEIKKRGLTGSNVCYMGNDITDIPCMESVAFSAAPADAFPEVSAVANIVSQRNGGDGAVRELCDLILEAREQ